MKVTRKAVSLVARRGRLWTPLPVALVLSGCFTYRAVEPTALPPGERVQVELTGAGRDNLRERRALDLPSLSGLLVNQSSEDLLLRVRLSPERLGYGSEPIVDTIRVPRADIREFGVRTLSKDRTIAAGAVTVAALAGAFALFQARQSSSGSDGGGGGQVFTVVPLSSILGMFGAGR